MNADQIAGYTLRSSHELETILQAKWGAQGKGLIERARSVRQVIPDDIFRAICYAGGARNKLVHDGTMPADIRRYVDAFERALAWARSAPGNAEAAAAAPESPRLRKWKARWLAVRFVLAMIASGYGAMAASVRFGLVGAIFMGLFMVILTFVATTLEGMITTLLLLMVYESLKLLQQFGHHLMYG